MELKEAIRILHPDTTSDAIAEIEYYSGFDNKNVLKKIDEAIICLINAAENQIPKEPQKIKLNEPFVAPNGRETFHKGVNIEKCGCCGSFIARYYSYCCNCGKKIKR